MCTNLRGLKVERKVSEEEEKKIQDFNPLYKRGSTYFPQGLCSTCHIFLLNKVHPHDQPTEQCSTEYAEAEQGGDAEAEQGGDAEQSGDAEAVQGGDEDIGSMREEREEEQIGEEGKKRNRPLPNVEPLFPLLSPT